MNDKIEKIIERFENLFVEPAIPGATIASIVYDIGAKDVTDFLRTELEKLITEVEDEAFEEGFNKACEEADKPAPL